MKSPRINRELEEFYRRVAVEFFRDSTVPAGLVGPFLISCPDGYSRLKIPWILVGQETCGWVRIESPAEVSSLMSTHAGFCRNNPWAGTPFWSFGYTLDRKLNPDGPSRNFVWSNISRIGFAGRAGRVPNPALDFWSEKRLLASEAKLLSPKLVLFVTGRRYDDLLGREFPGIKLPALSLDRPIARVSHPGLPDLTFKSYHPAYLRRKRRERDVLDFVVRRVQNY